MTKFPCSSCEKNFNINHRAIQCDICDQWIHLKCNFLNSKDYDSLKISEDPFICIKCFETIIPFSKLSNKEFTISVINGVNGFNNDKTNIDFLPPSEINTVIELNNFINQNFSPSSDDKGNGEEDPHPTNCNYYNIEEFTKANFNSSKSFSILHLNIHSIKKHIEELRITLNLLISNLILSHSLNQKS